MGFDGKTLIHPSHLETANRHFGPSPEEVEEARAIVAAFDDPANAGKGVLTVNGKMTEFLHRDIARRVLAVAQAIETLEAAKGALFHKLDATACRAIGLGHAPCFCIY